MALALLSAGACATSGTATLPALELETLDGDVVDLADAAADGPVILNLWATWCTPCRRELPAFDRAHTDAGVAVAVIGVNQGDERGAASTLLDELGIGFPQMIDERSELSRELGVTGMPSTAFVAEGGEILELHSGELDSDELSELIDRHFGIALPSSS